LLDIKTELLYFVKGIFIKTGMLNNMINVRRITLAAILLSISFLNCGSSRINQRQPAVPLQGMIKQLPGGSQYFVVYTLPAFFPEDIPVYRSGEIQQINVYDERDMDIIIKSTAQMSDIAEEYVRQFKELKWKINRNVNYPEANNQRIEIPISYKDKSIETLRFFTERGRILAASSGNIVVVCKLIKIKNTPFTFVIQQVRTM
jgi:hypothetical protein